MQHKLFISSLCFLLGAGVPVLAHALTPPLVEKNKSTDNPVEKQTQADASVKRYSTGGFYTVEGTGRDVASLNPAWRFIKDPEGKYRDIAWKNEFDDKKWEAVSLPDGMEYLPTEASGGKNYRGEAWYRKNVVLPEKYANKRIVLYFEAIMGKSKIWVNGNLVKEQFGGFLPISVDISEYAQIGKENIIAVWTDNSDDPVYPPGKPQDALDYCYFGGIYRDCWLISTNKDYFITDPNQTDIINGGGVVVTFGEVNSKRAVINVRTDVSRKDARIEYVLKDKKGNKITASDNDKLIVKNPNLWSPENPYLYNLEIFVKNSRGKIVDGYMQKVGIRTIEFTHEDGFILNGKPYPRKLIGANRHQDFAQIGNALSNNLHWRDALKLKEAGMEIVRNAHYPQDPAFMDACDELGLFVIENTPGWQFWNDEPIFAQRVYSDIRNMIRRDRNRASVIMWEPILNETWYPAEFASDVYHIVKEEMPGAYAASDFNALGSNIFDILFAHPQNSADLDQTLEKVDTTKIYFTREFGDNVDDWNSHNSPSRAAREWGEEAQLIQARHYSDPDYIHDCLKVQLDAAKYHVGGTLWHSFDHQRGYHPDPFYGGIMDAFRRPKYAYEMFKSAAEWNEPTVYIANEMTPFSSKDVIVFSNCPQIRLYTNVGDTLRIKKKEALYTVFENAWDHMVDKKLSRERNQSKSYLKAEGLDANNTVLATHVKSPARRADHLEIVIDTMNVSPVADGGDVIAITARIVDKNGNVKRLNNECVRFHVEGEARQIGWAVHHPVIPLRWGEASTLIQTTTTPGLVKIEAYISDPQGIHTPKNAEVSFYTSEPTYTLLYNSTDLPSERLTVNKERNVKNLSDSDRLKLNQMLEEVERQQSEFGEGAK